MWLAVDEIDPGYGVVAARGQTFAEITVWIDQQINPGRYVPVSSAKTREIGDAIEFGY